MSVVVILVLVMRSVPSYRFIAQTTNSAASKQTLGEIFHTNLNTQDFLDEKTLSSNQGLIFTISEAVSLR